jgi:hypothetical protein
MTTIWYEVFPITLVSQQASLIRQQQENKASTWMIQNQPNIHPSRAVVNSLVSFFGNALDLDQTIVHSTSWRYEDRSDELILTYLAVLPQGNWIKHWITQGLISIEPIGGEAVQYADHLFPPEHIKQTYVIAHALDHLASLSTYDPAIQATLDPEWKEVLRLRTPQSAGHLNTSSSTSANDSC